MPAGLSLGAVPRRELADLIGNKVKPLQQPQDVVLYGFGRIGRLMARILIEKTDGGDCLRLRAIVVRKGKAPNDLVKRVSLLRRDSVHGAFDGTIRVDEERQSFIANGNEVKVIYADSPDNIDYTSTASTTRSSSIIPVPGATRRACHSTSRARARAR